MNAPHLRSGLVAALGLLAAPALSHAATIQTSATAFAAAVGATTTTSTLGALFAPISSFTLSNGATVTVSGTADVVDQPGVGVLPFSNGYAGQVIDSTTNTETLTFSRALTSFGLTIQPDIAFVPTTPSAVSYAITLSDGTATTLNGSYVGGSVQFIGFTGGAETSIRITQTGSGDFAFGQFLTAAAATTVPEPATLGLLAAGLLALPLRRRA